MMRPNTFKLNVRDKEIARILFSGLGIFLLMRVAFFVKPLPISDYLQTWAGQGKFSGYQKNGAYYFVVGALQGLGFDYSFTATILTILSFTCFLFGVYLSLKSIDETKALESIYVYLIIISSGSYWFFTGFHVEPRIFSLGSLSLSVGIASQIFRLGKNEKSKAVRLMILFSIFFYLSINIAPQTFLVATPIFVAAVVTRYFLRKRQSGYTKEVISIILLVSCLNQLFNASTDIAGSDPTTTRIAKYSAIYVGLIAPSAEKSCGAWSPESGSELVSFAKTDALITLANVWSEFRQATSSSLLKCKLKNFYLSKYNADVTWVFNLGLKESSKFQQFPLSFLLTSGIFLQVLTLLLFYWKRKSKLHLAFLAFTQLYILSLVLILELNSRYFVNYLLIPILIYPFLLNLKLNQENLS